MKVLCINQDTYTFCKQDTNARVYGFVIEDILSQAPRVTIVEMLNLVQIRNKVVSIDCSSIFIFPSLFLEVSCVTYYPVKANMVLRSKHEDLVTIKPQNLTPTSFQFKIPSNSLNSQPIVYLIIDVEPNKQIQYILTFPLIQPVTLDQEFFVNQDRGDRQSQNNSLKSQSALNMVQQRV